MIHIHPPGPYTNCALQALAHIAHAMTLAQRTPEVAQAGDALMAAVRTGNYFRAAEAARDALSVTRSAFMPAIAEQLDRVLSIGTEKVALPYMKAREVAA